MWRTSFYGDTFTNIWVAVKQFTDHLQKRGLFSFNQGLECIIAQKQWRFQMIFSWPRIGSSFLFLSFQIFFIYKS